MPKATTTDISLTRAYIPKVLVIPSISPSISCFYRTIEDRNIHEGRVVDRSFIDFDHIARMFTAVRFNCLFEINEPIITLKSIGHQGY